MESPLLSQSSPKELTIIVLITLLISSKTTSDTQILQTEFYNRFKAKFFDRVHKIAYKSFRGIPEWENICEDVFQESFQKAFEILSTFKTEENWNEAQCYSKVLNWMSGIANIRFLTYAKDEKERRIAYEEYKYISSIDASNGAEGQRKNYTLTYDKIKIDRMMSKLNPMAKEIIFACAKHGTLEENNTAHLPDEVIKHLIQKYNSTPAALRKAKQRTIEALNKCKNI